MIKHSKHFLRKNSFSYLLQYLLYLKFLPIVRPYIIQDLYIACLLNVSDDEYVSACIGNLDTTSLSRFQFKDNGNVAGSALNTEANQEFQRSLKGWNQLLNERLHMSLKDFGFVSYE